MLLFRFLNYMSGYREVTCTAGLARDTVNLLVRKDIDYWSLSRNRDGELHFFILEKEWKRLCAELEDEDGGRLTTVKRYGLPLLLKRYRYRIGLPVGAVLIIALLSLSTQYVWDITVSGNDKLSDEEITAALGELGFGIGTRIPDVDYDSICHEFVLKNDDISWISVNMIGTTAEVRVIERRDKSDSDDNNGTPSNIVASRGGIIVRTETESGAAAVIGGQEVKEGDLLVSGVVQTDRYDEAQFVLVRSKAKVYAQTERAFKVEMPLSGTKNVYCGRETVSKKLNFFGRELNITKNSSILREECDIIKDNKRVVLFENSGFLGGIPLPVWVSTEYTENYKEEAYELTEEEALSAATEEMSRLFSEELSEAEILSRESSTVMREENGVTVLELIWTVTCIEDIGEEVPIGVK